MAKNPIMTRKYFIDRLKTGKWLSGDIPTSTMKDAEEIAKHMVGKNGVKQTRVVSYGEKGALRVHRNFSHEDYVANPKRKRVPVKKGTKKEAKNYPIGKHDNYVLMVMKSGKKRYYNGAGFSDSIEQASIWHDKTTAEKIGEMVATGYNTPVKLMVI